MSNERKIACLFPGIGYTCDKPLLYYSWKLLKGMGWDVVPVPYAGFPEKVKGNPEYGTGTTSHPAPFSSFPL